jgi:hypothetical protein
MQDLRKELDDARTRTGSSVPAGRKPVDSVNARRGIVCQLMKVKSDFTNKGKVDTLFLELDTAHIPLPERAGIGPRPGTYQGLSGQVRKKVISTLQKDLERRANQQP